MRYIQNIFVGLLIGALIGLFFGTIFGYKATKKNQWETRQSGQQIAFSILGAIGGAYIGFKIAEEDSQ